MSKGKCRTLISLAHVGLAGAHRLAAEPHRVCALGSQAATHVGRGGQEMGKKKKKSNISVKALLK